MTAVISPPVPSSEQAAAPADLQHVCHVVAAWPHALCGANLQGRYIHEVVDCIVGDHPRCHVCMGLEEGTVPGLNDEWRTHDVPNH